MKTETKKWHDETGGVSKIEGLNFSADRLWTECTITIKGSNSTLLNNPSQHFIVYFNGEIIFEGDLKGEKIIKKPIQGFKEFKITGEMSRPLLATGTAIGSVIVECTYDESSVFRSESVRWGDSAFVSAMEGLFLDATNEWKRCELKIEGRKNVPTSFSMQLIADGKLVSQQPCSGQLNGTESAVFTYDINGKVPLLVSGYITTGGANVTLTGFY